MTVWNPISVSPPRGLIVCKVGGTYVEAIVKHDKGNVVLMSEGPMEWADVEGWVAVPPDFYGFDGAFVQHERF